MCRGYLGVFVFVALLACCSAATLRVQDAQADDAYKLWSYHTGSEGPDSFGPESWYKIDPQFSMCEYSVMGEQSPIDLYQKPPLSVTLEDAKSDVTKKFKYRKPKGMVRNTGKVVEIVVQDVEDNSPGGVQYRSNHYKLRKISFHTPSEHTFGTEMNGGHGVMEMQMYHQLHPSTSGATMWVVVAILFETGAENGFLRQVEPHIPHAKLEKFDFNDAMKNGNFSMGPIDIHSLIDPLGDKYFTYAGSMTTPPCMEDVRWFVMKNTLKMSSKQLESFKAKLGEHERIVGNARPTMPLNLRDVVYVH